MKIKLPERPHWRNPKKLQFLNTDGSIPTYPIHYIYVLAEVVICILRGRYIRVSILKSYLF